MPSAVRTVIASLVFLAVTIAPAARADWMNLTGAETASNIAEITILDNRVRITLEIYIGNLDTFEALLPDEWLKKDVAVRPPLPERLNRHSPDGSRFHPPWMPVLI